MNSIYKAIWTAARDDINCPVFVRKFNVNNTKDAVLNITSLGFFCAYINGQTVTDGYFLPSITNYEKRNTAAFAYPIFDTLTYRIYYYSYSIEKLLHPGQNTLEIHLANGWYRQTVRKAEGDVAFGNTLKALYSIDFCDGTHLYSNGAETVSDGVLRQSQIFTGETIDKTFKAHSSPANIAPAPKSILCKAQGVPDRVIREITPKLIATVGKKRIYDAGENTSGIVRVTTHAAHSERIVLRFAENINADNTLNFKSAGGNSQIQTDAFVCDGTKTVFEPRFVWHAFRYFEIEGEFESVLVKVIHADVALASFFESDSDGLNFLYNAYIRTQLTNMHCSIPMDCPHRERLGYTGDGQVCADAAMLLLDSKELYKKWITDILDSQCKKSGHSQHTAPFMGGGGGPGGWGSAIVFVPYSYYRHFGDIQILHECYAPMKKWVEYLKAHSENGLVTFEEAGGWCLGDWATPEDIVLPESYVNTCFFIKVLQIMQAIAKLLNRTRDIDCYKALEKAAKQAVLLSYGDIGHAQGGSAYAVWCGIKDASLTGDIASYYNALGRFDTGIFATDILMELLFENGCEDTAFKLLNSNLPGSFLYMKERGATTLWELWSGKTSHNHPMFGACTKQLFCAILGIKQKNGQLCIAPKIPKDLGHAKGGLTLQGGPVTVEFKQKENRLLFNITLPKGTHAQFVYGGKSLDIFESADFEVTK